MPTQVATRSASQTEFTLPGFQLGDDDASGAGGQVQLEQAARRWEVLNTGPGMCCAPRFFDTTKLIATASPEKLRRKCFGFAGTKLSCSGASDVSCIVLMIGCMRSNI